MTFGDARGPESPAESETGRVEAFSDGVLAVIITIMAFELRARSAPPAPRCAAGCPRCWSTS